MRLWARPGVRINLSFRFSRAIRSAPDTPADKALFLSIHPISRQSDFRVPTNLKEKTSLSAEFTQAKKVMTSGKKGCLAPVCEAFLLSPLLGPLSKKASKRAQQMETKKGPKTATRNDPFFSHVPRSSAVKCSVSRANLSIGGAIFAPSFFPMLGFPRTRPGPCSRCRELRRAARGESTPSVVLLMSARRRFQGSVSAPMHAAVSQQ